MKRHTLRKCKAFFGAEAAAYLAGAGIQATATITGAATARRGLLDNARNQAQQMAQNTNREVQMMKEQMSNDKAQFEQNQEFIKEQNEQNREIQKQEQMMLQRLMAKQNQNDRLEASKITVRNGGSLNSDYNKYKLIREQNRKDTQTEYNKYKQLRDQNRKELEKNYNNYKKNKKKSGTNANLSLRGVSPSNNLQFTVTDGGTAVPIGQTIEGYDMYELAGNDHKHYHKTPTGNKTGVGLQFANGVEIEGEGNQNTTHGEKMIVTPNNAYFLSKHSIKGFNPSKAVDNGMNPLEAYDIQEQIKALHGLTDDGKELHVKKERAEHSNGGAWVQNNASWLSPAISGTGSLISGLIATSGNRKAANLLSNAELERGRQMANAYRQLKGIDINGFVGSAYDTYKAANAMPAIQTPTSYASQPLSEVNRSLQRRLANAERNSASSMVANTRSNVAETDAQDARNRIYNADQQQMAQVRQANADRITQESMHTAEMNKQANIQRTSAILDALKYDADIKNESRLGQANALSQSGLNSANILASMRAQNSQIAANTMANIANTASNALSSYRKEQLDYNTNFANNLAKSNPETAIAMVNLTNDRQKGLELYNLYKTLASKVSNADNKQMYESYIAALNNKFNFEKQI